MSSDDALVVVLRTERWACAIAADATGDLCARSADGPSDLVVRAPADLAEGWVRRRVAPRDLAASVVVDVGQWTGLSCIGVPTTGCFDDRRLACGPFRALYRCEGSPFGRAPVGVAVMVGGTAMTIEVGCDLGSPADLVVDMAWRDFVGWFGDPTRLFGDLVSVPGLSGELSMIAFIEGARTAAGMTTDPTAAATVSRWAEAWRGGDPRRAIAAALAAG